MRWLAAFLLAVAAQAQTLSPALSAWRQEIEKQGGGPVLVARVYFDKAENTVTLGEDTPRRELFAQYLKQEEYAAQLQMMFAMTVVHRGPDGPAALILLNMAREAEWRGHEDAVLGHELGHAWIRAQGYAAPIFQPGLAGCLAINTGDIVQHILIRKEMDARGIEHLPFWLKTLDEATQAAAGTKPPPEEDRCVRVRQAEQLVDVRLGLNGVEWPGREAYEKVVARVFPEVEGTVEEIVDYLKDKDVADKDVHRTALAVVFEKLKALAYQRSRYYMLENRHPSDARWAAARVGRARRGVLPSKRIQATA
jgi:hypothetical protein